MKIKTTPAHIEWITPQTNHLIDLTYFTVQYAPQQYIYTQSMSFLSNQTILNQQSLYNIHSLSYQNRASRAANILPYSPQHIYNQGLSNQVILQQQNSLSYQNWASRAANILPYSPQPLSAPPKPINRLQRMLKWFKLDT